MKKIIQSILFMIVSFASQSQTISFKDTVLKEEAFASVDDIIVHTWFHNNSGKTDLKWVRIFNAVPNGWESAVCDNVQCYGPEVDSANFILSDNDSFYFSFHFYPEKIRGTGSITVCVYVVSDPSIRTCGTYSVVGWGAGIDEMSSSVNIFPNPADKVVYFKEFLPKAGTVKLTDLTGKIVFQKNISGASDQISVEELPDGCYTLSVESTSAVKHQRILVQH